jgi:recombinational DNA repair protein (RecF pathway)
MCFKTIAFVVGFFSCAMGMLTYDSEVVTAPIPVITGAIVMLLAVLGFIPELKNCINCNRKILNKAETCRYCGAKQPEEERP